MRYTTTNATNTAAILFLWNLDTVWSIIEKDQPRKFFSISVMKIPVFGNFVAISELKTIETTTYQALPSLSTMKKNSPDNTLQIKRTHMSQIKTNLYNDSVSKISKRPYLVCRAATSS